MRLLYAIVVSAGLLSLPAPGNAYIGPGVGLSAIGSVLAFAALILVLLAGLLWYPVKSLLRRKRTSTHHNDADAHRYHADSDESTGL